MMPKWQLLMWRELAVLSKDGLVDGPPGPIALELVDEVLQLQSKVEALEARLAAASFATERVQALHRRTQQAESEAIAVPRRFEGALRDVTRRWKNSWHAGREWKKRYKAEVEKIRNSGLVDTTSSCRVSTEKPMQTGYLNILVDRLIERARKGP